ncbi:MAG: isopentenyl phosphate kinase [Candidatus Hodarchaeota archaeon]
MDRNLTYLKIGGSVITDKTTPEKLLPKELNRIAKEIHSAGLDAWFQLIIGNGAGSFGHIPAKQYHVRQGIDKTYEGKMGLCLTSDAALRLNRHVVRALIDQRLPAMSVSPSVFLVTEDGQVLDSHLTSIQLMLKLGIIPCVHGDVALDVNKGTAIVSTEEVFMHLALMLGAGKILLGTREEGVLQNVNDPGSLISEINPKNIESVRTNLQGSHGTDVTGGMLGKVEAAFEMSRKTHAEVFVFNLTIPGRLESVLKGEIVSGTLISS